MKRPLKVGVTGGIGSGKTLICRIFAVFGVPIYYADERAKYLMVNDSSLKKKISNTFGNKSYNSDFTLNRNFLANKVFNDPEQLNKLNALVHPIVRKDFEEFIHKNINAAYLVEEAALIFESGAYNFLDYTINVSAPEEERVHRILKRDPFRGEQQIKSIIQKQLSDEEREKMADYGINNDGVNLIIPQVLKLHQIFLKLS